MYEEFYLCRTFCCKKNTNKDFSIKRTKIKKIKRLRKRFFYVQNVYLCKNNQERC